MGVTRVRHLRVKFDSVIPPSARGLIQSRAWLTVSDIVGELEQILEGFVRDRVLASASASTLAAGTQQRKTCWAGDEFVFQLST